MTDDDLEVGLAAGLDVPTAIVLSEENPPPRSGSGCVLLLGSLGVLVLWWLGR